MRQADFIKEETHLVYNINKPSGILLKYYLMLEQRHDWSYGGENINNELNLLAKLTFKNYWNFSPILQRTFNEIDTRQLRGGPSLRIDANTRAGILFQTNSSKNFIFASKLDLTRFDDKISWQNRFDVSLSWLINNNITLSSLTSYTNEANNSQYVTKENVNDKMEYVVGKIDRQTFFTTFRAEYFITPELSLQYYGSPYASIGKYNDFRKVNQSKAKDLNERYSPLYISDDGKILEDENGNQLLDLETENPDFDFLEFRSNFVLRWEYKTGSTFYFVWTNSGVGDGNTYYSQNAFMLKFSYWFSL
jgi:hypothetical protein